MKSRQSPANSKDPYYDFFIINLSMRALLVMKNDLRFRGVTLQLESRKFAYKSVSGYLLNRVDL